MPNYSRRIKTYSDVELRAAHNAETRYLNRLREQIELPLPKADIREFKRRARQAARDLRGINREQVRRAKSRVDKRPFGV